jgi:quinol monooxygenase YgiN
MMVKILIQRKIKPGKEEEFKRLVRELFMGAIHAEGFISGETMQSIDDSTLHMTIGTWRSIKHWNDWISSSDRRKSQEKLDQVLAEPMKITPFHYE